ncbi:MAG: efflux RND transporter periplasmic adaptor subunit [bacterium]|nr:efflux RND transporter periplasmic adaptor subunit [bacterium]
MKHFSQPITIASSVALVVLGLGCADEGSHATRTELEPVQVSVVQVETVTAEHTIEIRGIVQPSQQANISSRVVGPVVSVKVRPGSVVNKGQALVEIQPEAAEGQLSQAAGALAQVKAAHALAERNFRRYEALHGEGAASELELDMARMQFEQAQGAVEQAQGAVKSATSVANEAIVRAPFNARIVQTLVEVGDLAAPGRHLVRLEALGGQQFWLSIRESQIHLIETGTHVAVELDSRPDLGLIEGVIDEIIPSADPATHSFTVKVGLGTTKVPSGISGRAHLAGESNQRLVIPVSAVHARGGLELVVVRSSDGSSRTRAVTTGAQFPDGRIEVLSGLAAGESVAVDAPGPMTDGTPLEVRR